MINVKQLEELIIVPTLQYLEPEIPFSDAAVELLKMTAAHESHLGSYIAQVGGPALGIYQMEPATEDDIHRNFIDYRHGLSDQLYGLINNVLFTPPVPELVNNLAYATAMARVHYYRDKYPLPDVMDIEGLAQYAKRVYNTVEGKAEWRDYYNAYNRYC